MFAFKKRLFWFPRNGLKTLRTVAHSRVQRTYGLATRLVDIGSAVSLQQ